MHCCQPPGSRQAPFPLTLGFLAVVAALAGPVHAQNDDPSPAREPASEQTLPPVQVRGEREPEVTLPVTAPTTTFNREALERGQAENVFEVIQNAPGVMVEGGPRASGMRFNLRGFADNEDVTFKIDGAVKGFEKYRFGGGVFVEPELLKAIEVERGPSLTSGSGALGGTISATTRSAADFLRPGEKYGALTRFGYNWNNRERLRMLAAFGRPTGSLDLLAAITRRDSADVRQANGDTVAVSATHSESTLLKAGFFPTEHLQIELSRIGYQSGPERAPYDATRGDPGIGGIVRRDIDDATVNLRFNYTPPDSWLNLRGLIANEKTRLHDLHQRGESSICAVAAIVPYCNDFWRYSIWTSELFNDTRYRLGPVGGTLTVGYQGIRNSRDVVRISANERVNDLSYPGGFNEAQPPGDKVSHALILQNAFDWGDLTFTPGGRWDRYTVSATKRARENMVEAGQAPDIAFSKLSPAASLSWRIMGSPWTLTGRYNQAFRPPLIDEYFARGGFGSRCQVTPINPDSGRPYSPTPGAFYDPVTGIDHAPATSICGDLYRPQESSNRELILGWTLPPQSAGGGAWQGRLTWFESRTRYLLTSLAAVNGVAAQPGHEKRQGVELEIHYASNRWFGGLTYGRMSGWIVDAGIDPATGAVNADRRGLYGVPANTLVLNLGARGFDQRLEGGIRLRNISDRQVYADPAPTSCTSAGTMVPGTGYIGTHFGVRLIDLYARWQVTRDIQVRGSLDNITNETYCLVDGFGAAAGPVAAGRTARLSVSVQF